MKTEKIRAPFISLAAISLVACAFPSIYGQTPSGQAQATPQPQTQNNAAAQSAQVQSLPDALNFTPQQVQQWRQINREFRGQEIAAASQVRDARQALNDAMESSAPNEDLIKQRAKELADAQSALTQLNALRQARVLQILTPEQRVKLKEIKEQHQALKHQQQQSVNGLNQRQQIKRANTPQVTPVQRKALKPQQKQKR